MMFFLGLGALAWSFVCFDFACALAKRRSAVRGIFVVMSLGWPLVMLRELHLLPRDVTTPLLAAGICAGLWSGVVLLARWLRDPRVLE